MLTRRTLVMIGVLVLLGGTAAPASPVDHDAYVDVNDPDAVHNTADLVVAASTTACSPTDMVYLRWDLSHISPVQTVTTATLTLTPTLASNTGTALLALYATEDGWDEATLTYNTAPPPGARIEVQAAPSQAGQPLAFRSAALVDYLNAEAHGDGAASLTLQFSDGCAVFSVVVFRAREAGGGGPDLALATEIHAADLAVDKAGPATVAIGRPLTYTLRYTNVGTLPAQGVVLTDVLPTVLDAVQVISAGGTLTPRVGSRFVWDVAPLDVGAGGAVTVTGVVAAPTGDTLVNEAAIAARTVESDTTNNRTAPVTTAVRLPDLALTKAGPAAVAMGRSVTYTLAYTNEGTAPAHGVVLTDVLPTVLDAVQVISAGGTLTPRVGSRFVWDVGHLPAGQGGWVTVTASLPLTYTGPLTNTAAIATAAFELDRADNAPPPVVIDVRPLPDLTVDKVAPATVGPGTLITYKITYTNQGPASVPRLLVVDTLPPAVQLHSHSGSVILPSPADEVVWEVYDLAPEASGVLTVTGVVSSAFTGVMTNTVTVLASLPELRDDNNVAHASTRVVVRELYLPWVVR